MSCIFSMCHLIYMIDIYRNMPTIIMCGAEVSETMNIEIRSFDIMRASSEDWARFDEFMKEWYKEFDPDEKYQSEAMKKQLQVEMVHWNIIMYEAVHVQGDEKTIGFFRMMHFGKDSPSYEENKHMCEIRGPLVLQAYARQGLATRMLSYLHDEMEGLGKHTLTGVAVNDAGQALVQKIGGKVAQVAQENRLYLNETDWNMMQEWVNEGQVRSPETRIEIHRSVPDDLLEQYCNVYTEVMNQAPRDELKVGDIILTPDLWRESMQKISESEGKFLTAFTVEKDGNISGLTDVIWVPSRPTVLVQRLTGVQVKYRGRGLGKWLKGAVLLRVKDEFPDVTSISTGNAASNEPMLDINRRMGFKLHRQMYVYQVELAQLKEYLKGRE